MKMKRTGTGIATSIVSIYVMISLIGCTVAWDALPNGSFEVADIIDPVASVVEEQYQTIEPVLLEHDEAFRVLSRVRHAPRDGRQIVSNMLEEERGEEYLQFTYTLLTSEDPQEVVAQAEHLVSDDEYQELLEEVDRAVRQFNSFRTELSRSVPSESAGSIHEGYAEASYQIHRASCCRCRVRSYSHGGSSGER